MSEGARRPRWRLWLIRSLLIVAGLYILLLVALVLNERRLLYFPHARVDRPPDSSVQVVAIDTADGERLVAWYRPPAPGRPVILFFDGNGGRLDYQWERWAATRTVGVGQLSVAYRRYAGSTGAPTEAGLHEDARSAYR